MKDKVIIFFTRIPTLGKNKTRLEPFLSKELCVKLQTAFIKDIYNNIRSMGIDIIINYSEHGDLEVLKSITHKGIYFLKQEGKDLGEKMHNAILFSLKEYRNVALIGSDLPLLNKKDIEIAFSILETKDIVISPTYDGGYYLIGMKEENPDIFNIRYSTSSVFEETIDKIKSTGRSYGKGNIQLDIDDKGDFLRLHKILKEDESISCDNTRKLVKEVMGKCDKNE
ncbi:TIGR04282 family arsenosugar biosynthesis glycosyltransferase [Alkaliphilus sp. MSJ-5]|uniref:TIGR04282 family arsenosugar biosynthesis glycosyltransferase n=1 Tax=Alkaliphilus flagellatus TaxID=2841507 RepID=A0ABS6FZQ5_9FIRM|nr:TIGR04282 family arsenosugar biosynthesis glycosyltransferase [Alkaliphilus flagellatus]MBU5675730.1 TIGR04282 family arsenosugar biosynthesis glycosyltransferase [Alkaliphilus flagellatus]